jgi:hypothetical protein
MARVRFLDQVPVGFYDVNNSNGGTPGGPSNSIQYNDGGTFNGDINLRWDNNTDTVLLTGSIIATSFTGSLFGTSSFAISASQAQTASYVLSASYALSSSQAQTASYVNPLNQDVIITGSLSNGINVNAIGLYSHAEGNNTFANGISSHTEGQSTIARGAYSHAEGGGTVASGTYSHAEGQNTIAQGESSHAEGIGTITSASYQHAQGMYNITSSISGAFMLGNGTGLNRSNLIFAAGNQVQITGSLNTSGSVFFPTLVTSSTAVSNVVMYGTNGQLFITASSAIGGGGISGDYVTTASFNAYTGSSTSQFAGTASFATTASYVLNAVSASYALSSSQAQTASYVVTAQTASYVLNAVSASYALSSSQAQTASYVVTAQTASYVVTAQTASYVLSASYALSSSQAQTASYALNGGVTKILAGANINLSPVNGLGDVTVTSFGTNLYNTATGSYGSFFDTGSVLAASVTAIYSMSLNTTDISNGVFISASNGDNTRIKFTNAGTYNVQFSSQFSNTDNSNQDIVIWVKKNGVDIPDSSGVVSVPPFKAGSNGQVISGWNYFLNLSANDFIQMCWHVEQANVITLETIAAGTSPTHPRTPSTILTANRVDTFLSNTGSFSGSFVGSLSGTASFATSASQAQTASYVVTAQTASYVLSASYALSSSQAQTASFALTASTTPQLYRIINNTDSATITGSTALTLLYSQLIPANTFAVNDVIRLSSRGLKTGVTSGSALNHYINTSNTISGATLLASYSPAANIRMLQNDRKLYIKNITGNTEVYHTTTSNYLDFQPTATQVFGNIAINWTVDQYIIFGGQLFGSADSFKGSSYEIERIRTT